MAVFSGNGSAASPSFTFSSDTNTGIYRYDADNLAFATAGTFAALFDDTQRLILGHTESRTLGVGEADFQVNDLGVGLSVLRYTTNPSGPAILTLARTRGTDPADNTAVQADDGIGRIDFAGGNGSDVTNRAGYISVYTESNASGSWIDGEMRFATTETSDTSGPQVRMVIRNNGQIELLDTYNNTTGNTANLQINSNGIVRRSTSSIKYKTNVETLEDIYADAILNIRPVWYRSLSEADNPNHSWWGFIAEEVAGIDPRLVQWKTTEITRDENGSRVETPCDPEPDGVQYDRFVPHLLNLIKRQKEQIEAMEARLSALEAQ